MEPSRILNNALAFFSRFADRELARIAVVDDARLLLVIFAVTMILLVIRLLRRRFWLFFYAAFLSILMHELAHFLVALVTNGKPRGLSVVPEQRGNAVVLGQVLSANTRWYNGTLIALAPLFLWAFAYSFFFAFVLKETNGWILAVNIYLLASLIEGGLPSTSDVRLAARYAAVPLLIGAGLAAMVYFGTNGI